MSDRFDWDIYGSMAHVGRRLVVFVYFLIVGVSEDEMNGILSDLLVLRVTSRGRVRA